MEYESSVTKLMQALPFEALSSLGDLMFPVEC